MSFSTTIEYDDRGLRERLRAWPGEQQTALEAGVRDVADAVFAESQRNVNVDKGTLKKSGSVIYGSLSASVGYNTPYAKYVHEGTAPHIILPKKPGGYLRFETDGQVVYARRVKHPGYRGNPYLRDAVESTRPTWGALIRRQLRLAWTRLKGGAA